MPNITKISFIYILWSVLFIYAGSNIFGQSNTDKIIIENADNQVIDNTQNPPIKHLRGNVRAYHEGSFFFCDSARLIGNTMFAFGQVAIIQHDTIHIFCDELFYDGDSLFSYLKSKVVLKKYEDKLFTEYLEYDMKVKKAYYRDKALLMTDGSEVKSQKGIYDVNLDIATFQEKVTVKGKDYDLFTDTLEFDTKKEIAKWTCPALIYTDSSKIYSDNGWYNTKNKTAELIGNAQYIKKDVVSTAKQIYYDGQLKEISLYGNAKYHSEKDTASADTMIYNEVKDLTILHGHSKFKGKNSNAEGDVIIYDKKNDKFILSGRGTISDSTFAVTSNFIDYDKKLKKGVATGDVIWVDSAAHTTLLADSVYTDDSEKYMHASNKKGKPILISKIDNDSLFLTADTLKRFKFIRRIQTIDSLSNLDSSFIAKKIKNDTSTFNSVELMTDSLRKEIVNQDTFKTDTTIYFSGINHVEIFKNDMQGKCDSLLYNEKDSIFILMQDPIMWSDSTQLTGDTIKIHMKNKTVNKLEQINNALVISTTDDLFYNQIGGRKITGYFKEKELKTMKVIGNARSIYYLIDDQDQSYIGVNQTECSTMQLNFENKKVKTIQFYTSPTAKILPMDKTDHESLKLKGFVWKFIEKPLKPITDLVIED